MSPEVILELYRAVNGPGEPDETHVRQLAYRACDGDAYVLLTGLLRTIRDLAEQLAQFYGSSVDEVLRMEAYLPVAAAPQPVAH